MTDNQLYAISDLCLTVIACVILLGGMAFCAERVDPPRALESLPVERCR